MPELPEVEALALDLRGRLDGRAIAAVHLAAFSALKTYDPPVSALAGTLVDDVTRHGKFLDIEASGLHVVLHLARAGWVRWKDEVPSLPPRPSSKSGLAVRIVLDDDSGLDITEAGTKKSLAMYVVRDPLEVPGIASLGPRPAHRRLHPRGARARSSQREGRKQIKGVLRHQGTIAGIGNAYSDEILHAARMSPYRPVQRHRRATTSTCSTPRSATPSAPPSTARAAWPPASSRARRRATSPSTARPARPARSAATPCARCRSPTPSLQYCPTCQTGGKPLADRRMSKLLK